MHGHKNHLFILHMRRIVAIDPMQKARLNVPTGLGELSPCECVELLACYRIQPRTQSPHDARGINMNGASDR